jgi:hypothetical protein
MSNEWVWGWKQPFRGVGRKRDSVKEEEKKEETVKEHSQILFKFMRIRS